MSKNRKKILLLSDDLRMTSGIARMSREFVENTIHKYDWVQISGAIQHPEAGKQIVIESDDNFKLPPGSSITLYPTDGYGNPDLLRDIIRIENPDAILHFTDPRQWIWLYNMEHEIRQNIPIMYYNIWDDLPDPMYNKDYYRSSDLLMSISKQTYGINKRILSEYDYKDWQLSYVPHGVSEKRLFKIDSDSLKYKKFEMEHGFDNFKFKILYVNRNIRRKMAGDVIMAYKYFMDKLTVEQQKECCLIFHTTSVDENGTDLPAVCNAMIPNYNVIFTNKKYDDIEMNYLYNTSSVYINLASNEGFGLGSCEALMVGTPIVVNVTGGLQDQCGFKNDKGKYLTENDYVKIGSNHRGQYKNHGKWVKPVFPTSISLVGSPMTPYIYDDRCDAADAGKSLYEWYDMSVEDREKCGELGTEFVKNESNMTGKLMSKLMIKSINGAFKNWKPKKRYELVSL